jgi:hypothetical protein
VVATIIIMQSVRMFTHILHNTETLAGQRNKNILTAANAA